MNSHSVCFPVKAGKSINVWLRSSHQAKGRWRKEDLFFVTLSYLWRNVGKFLELKELFVGHSAERINKTF